MFSYASKLEVSTIIFHEAVAKNVKTNQNPAFQFPWLPW